MSVLTDETRAAVLRAADFFVANPTARTTSRLARNKVGEPVSPTSPNAICWCAVGRIAKELGVGYDEASQDTQPVYTRLNELGLPVEPIWMANDWHPKTERLVDILRSVAANV
jgi:hypothetical protein